jgi:SAM-dependent methyltransferase
MHADFLSLLCCPQSGAPLRLEGSEYGPGGNIITGVLSSEAGTRYSIIRSIPRFVLAENYADSFGFEWNRWPRLQFESENVGKPTVVEFGCGPGRFLDVVRRKGGRAVGVDLSRAVEVAGRNFSEDPNVLIVQGDLLQPPFRNGVFDGGYSIGVLHHTPRPPTGLRALAQTIKPGGWIACSVYPKGSLYDFRSTARLRKLHHVFKARFGYRPALFYSYLSAFLLVPGFRLGKKFWGLRSCLNWIERQCLVNLHLRDVRWRVLDTFDAITPTLASTHTDEEVRGWMEQAGCSSVQSSNWGPASLNGVRDLEVD